MNGSNSTPPTAGLLCPACKVVLLMSDRQGIEVDFCPNCRGVWLDRGELDKIIERSFSDTAGAVPRPPLERSYPKTSHGDERSKHSGDRQDRDGHGHRRESFLSRLFD